MEILDRMLSGRFKAFEHLEPFFEELRMYHREDGKIVKVDEDVLDAVRYAVMMLRHAKLPEVKRRRTNIWVPKDPGMGY